MKKNILIAPIGTEAQIVTTTIDLLASQKATVSEKRLFMRMGCFPAVLRIFPEAGSLPPVYHAVEVLNLQAIRDSSRKYR